MKSIWVVDDDHSIRFVLEKALAREGLPVRSFSNARDMLAALDDDTPQVLVSDIRMPGGSGLELLAKVKARLPALPVIIMTAYSDLDSAVSAFQGGAFEYLPKPFDLPRAVELIRRAQEESQREAGEQEAAAQVPEMLGQAPAMQDVFRAIGRLSQSNVTVMITGESGSGKELVARALHKHSPRGEGPFVAINTAAIPKDLLESELFGHERGAFTGAQQRRAGQIEAAAGGVLMLDEVSEMTPSAQVKLLRVLQEREFTRLGSTRPVKADIRLIAATNRDLRAAMERGDFRDDLYYRLQVFGIRIPPLRDRPEDILALTEQFLEDLSVSLGRAPAGLTHDAKAALLAHPWRGNARELRNALERAAIIAEGGLIAAEHLGLDLVSPRSPVAATSVPAMERQLIERALRETRGNKARAARMLGLSRKQLYHRLAVYGLSQV